MRFRMKSPFGDASLLNTKIRAYADLTRPFTLLAPLLGGLLFAVMALLDTNGVKLDGHTRFQIIYGAVTLVLLNAGSNAVNQAADYYIDRVNKPYRPIPSGIVSRDEAYSIGAILWVVAILRSILINPVFAILCVLILACSWTYSLGPELKKRYIWNNLIIATSRGLLGPMAGWCIVGDITNPVIWAMGSVFFVYVFGSTVFKDIPDEKGDKEHDVVNFVTKHGSRKALAIGLSVMFACHLPLILYTVGGVLPTATIWFHVSGFITLYISWITLKDSDTESPMENNMSWFIMYIQLMLMMLFFFLMFLMT